MWSYYNKSFYIICSLKLVLPNFDLLFALWSQLVGIWMEPVDSENKIFSLFPLGKAAVSSIQSPPSSSNQSLSD